MISGLDAIEFSFLTDVTHCPRKPQKEGLIIDNAVSLNSCHECRECLGKGHEITYFYTMKHMKGMKTSILHALHGNYLNSLMVGS